MIQLGHQVVWESLLVWGKIIGGMAGFAFGGPFGAVLGAAAGHAAESGGFADLGAKLGGNFRVSGMSGFGPARIASMFGRREQLFAVAVVVLSAKLAKCDGPVNRAEIDAFKRSFQIPPESARDIGRLFDQARDSSDGFDEYAAELGTAFADSPGVLEDVLTALFNIARADKPLTVGEQQFLLAVCHRFGLGEAAWQRASGATPRRPAAAPGGDDPYLVLGVSRTTPADELRAAWKRLMRENHPDSLASRGVPAEFIARASAKVARINAAWDQIKRERGL